MLKLLQPPLRLICKPHFPSMNVFTQKLNPITGKSDWEVQNEDYDYHQEVARSSFADMLHDVERNQKYEAALKVAIDKMHSLGKRAIVLDIGTGTGLLSMVAVRNGADSVTACEAFRPMSICAQDVIMANGMEDKIKVVPKRSTELTVGEGCDMPERANILVTEVFDTELIGEGALSTFSHAHKQLLQKDCIVIPQSATIYAQIVDSPSIQNWNKLKDFFSEDGDLLVKTPETVRNCPGAAAVHDLQLSQLPGELIRTLVPPQPVLRFDFSGSTPFVFERSTLTTVKTERSGTARAVLMWWDLKMDVNNEIVLSCAPLSSHPDRAKGEIPWRDHWMQAIYYFPKEIDVGEKEEVHLVSCHDEFSLWFNLRKDLKLADEDYLRPICECGLHVAFSRTRIGQINDGRRVKKYASILQEHVNSDSVVLILSHGCYVGLSAAKLGAKMVYVLESNVLLKRILRDFVVCNNFTNVEVIEDPEDLLGMQEQLSEVTVVFSEPYFTSSILPWDNLLFAYLLREIKPLLKEDVKIVPSKAVIKAVTVGFKDLHKIRAPLGDCEGFTMLPFDELIKESSGISDSNVEAQPLWEYPGTALSAVKEICCLDLLNFGSNFQIGGTFDVDDKCGKCNGVALWVDWIFEGESKVIVSTGPIVQPKIGDVLKWDVHTRQGVYLFQETDTTELQYMFSFNCDDGLVNFICK